MCRSLTEIDWGVIDHFTKDEFSEDPTHLAEPLLMYTLDDIRKAYKKRVRPSKAKGALARNGGNTKSQHYAKTRKSTAVDVFPEGYPISFYTLLMSNPYVNGIGIYLDTRGNDGTKSIMFHMDIREKGYALGIPWIWIVRKEHLGGAGIKRDVYYYPQVKPEYWKLLSDPRLYKEK